MKEKNRRKKALVIASVASMLDNFNRDNISILQGMGYDVTVAANFHTAEDINSQEEINRFAGEMHRDGVHIVHIDFSRKIWKVRQQAASALQVKKLLAKKFDLIHCHAIICAAIVRMGAEKYRESHETKVIYTAHGFRFCKGAPLKNWLFYYSAEWIFSWWTDVLVTINREDYKRALKKLHAKRTVYVPGIGIDMEKFKPGRADREKKRAELGLKESDVMLFSVGELSRRKNHSVVIRAMSGMDNRNLHYFIAGQGELRQELLQMADTLEIQNRLHLLGYRIDISELLQAADLFVFPSLLEGLPVALMEAMASGVPCAASRIRGNTDLIADKNCLADVGDVEEWKRVLEHMISGIKGGRNTYGEKNRKHLEKYSISHVNRKMKMIYESIWPGMEGGTESEERERGKRIVITRSNPVDPDSRVEKEANSLLKAGYDVTILAWDRSANYFVRHDRKKLPNGNVPRITFGAQAEYGAGMKSLPSYLKFQISLFVWLLKNKNRYDIFHFCDFDTAFTGSHVCRIFGKKYIFDIFDYLSTDAETFFQRFIEKRENNIINHADATIICSEKRTEQIRKAKPRKLTVVHNSPEIMSSLERKNINNDVVKIAYIGCLQDYRLLPEMVHAISVKEGVELHIGGLGKYEAYMREASEKYANIFFYGKLQYEDTLRLEADCDLMTAIYDPKIGNHVYAAPNKFYEALCLGKPLIMAKETGMSEFVMENKIGTLIDFNEEGFVEGLDRLIAEKETWGNMGSKMKKLYNEKFSWKTMEGRLIQLYQEI